ncbi:type IVB secretion system protein IcmH/DotU [Faucicola atlantae]|uniref:type IVB secretion system protein IcmH/DotU n=1 Tax=Faucicola atlantae TaxID=34059 RepID=UPI0025B00979|nr:type IVB secretion system protein IcmH/DotU [Moraxella atlantae]
MTQPSPSAYQLTEVFNPITEAAKPIFILANAMKRSNSHLTVEAILNKFSILMGEFEETAERHRATYDSIKAAKYCLCTFVDEMAAKAGWADETWAQKSLLVTFFDETWGGERFFEILENAKRDIEKNLYLLEFIYICLQFGYKGKYQVLPNGDITIANIKQDLLNIINQHRPDRFDSLLAKGNVTQQITEEKRKFLVPLWVVAVLTSVLVGAIYFGLQWWLGGHFNKVSTQVNSLALPKVIASTPVAIQTKTERLGPLLANEIAQKLVEVQETPDRSTVTIKGDGLFESGSENIQDQYFPVLARVGQCLRLSARSNCGHRLHR